MWETALANYGVTQNPFTRSFLAHPLVLPRKSSQNSPYLPKQISTCSVAENYEETANSLILFLYIYIKNKVVSERVKITAAVPLLQVCTQRSLERLLTVAGWSVAGKSNYLHFLLSFVASGNKWP